MSPEVFVIARPSMRTVVESPERPLVYCIKRKIRLSISSVELKVSLTLSNSGQVDGLQRDSLCVSLLYYGLTSKYLFPRDTSLSQHRLLTD